MDELHAQAVQMRILGGMLAKLAGQDLEQRLQAAGVDVSALQFIVMRRISRCSATISEVSSGMLLAPATLVPVVDALERKGLLERVPNGQDRRRKELRLTAAGCAWIERLPLVMPDDRVVQALAQLGPERARRLTQLLRELVTHMAPQPEMVERALQAAHSADASSAERP